MYTCICTVCVFVCMSVCVPLGLFIILSFLSLYNVCSMVLDACAFHVHESVHVYTGFHLGGGGGGIGPP